MHGLTGGSWKRSHDHRASFLPYTWPSVGFWIFDQHAIHIDTPSAELTITQRSEIVVFEKKFARHQQLAVYGQEARDLINKALSDLSSEPPDPS
ncbi:MAG: hypothetical protein WCF33_13670 [Pseudonocardiaceae bacterium]